MSDALIGAGAQGVGGASSLAGGITQGMAARRQGLYQNQVAQINAQLAQMQAKDAVRRGDIESSQALVRGQQIVSAQRVAAGASGVDPNSGSAAQSQASSTAMSQLDALTISHNAHLEAIGYNMQASNYLTAGRMAKIAGNNANAMDITTGVMKFGQSLAQGAANYNQYRPTVPIEQHLAPLQQADTYSTNETSESNWRKEDEAPVDNDAGQSPWGGSNESEGSR